MKNDKLIRVEELTLGLEEDESVLGLRIAELLEIKEAELLKYTIVKRAIDSRNKRKILFVFSVDVELKNPEDYLLKIVETHKDKIKRHRIRLQMPYIYELKIISQDIKSQRPVIIGSGPSGLFAALLLAQAGLKPLVVERGKDVEARIKDVNQFFKEGKLNTQSNIQFGEGGAGTFSDGKLYTMVDNPRKKYIFDELINAGASPEIAIDAQAHIGTDKLRKIVKNIREKIIKLGGEVRFETCLTDIEIVDDKIVTAIFNENEKISVDELVVAVGHSARDTYEMLHEKNLTMTAKPFAIGLRIEHQSEMINKSQYGNFYNHPKLPAARYKLVEHVTESRSVYTFCMCPGGYVVAAASEDGRLVTNGMSENARDSDNSNSALLVNVLPSDFKSDHPLAGVEFQRKWEEKAFSVGGGNYRAPAQLVGDFMRNKPSTDTKSVTPTYQPGVRLTSLSSCLPDYVLNSIRKALPEMERKIKGFSHPDAILTGVETRSSSPVRIFRDESLQSNIKGIYPAGEGAGYAGGIISAAIDGMLVAEAIIDKRLNK
ncbi:NAD(P)/FAD-dependent oxidoreductase [Candidatus Parcubacteria bacterium]|nr:NAD(P)/FAD-dependent oxidoreductase [Patescibacteria group bacterium]MBU4309097.1 NAD(P)/FAD-dependent oxidoreductase [Patescibacteria group bacterium]MBU4431943.1 NAD(P)/FAD-dependent oxidoreductase [Patescibacteria group bacterium]MBU4577458.1 NAD(P)/FAD-dependent oxidoreductase [Patescibacteria group bacterium]MCG2697146.1 NAD(P)/FAD-dependent oxidoreductase [Candidatus Parcubacteria bacterium]